MFMFIRSKYGRAIRAIRDDEIAASASGSVTLDGQDLQKAPPHKIINMGLAHVPEGRHVFARYIRMEDKRRANYYRYYTGEEWRDAAGYDLCLDSAALGEDGCVERIIKLLPGFIN